MSRRVRRGFTLLEITFAMIVMGILAALALPSLVTYVIGAQAHSDGVAALGIAKDAITIASTDSVGITTANALAIDPSTGHGNYLGRAAAEVSTPGGAVVTAVPGQPTEWYVTIGSHPAVCVDIPPVMVANPSTC